MNTGKFEETIQYAFKKKTLLKEALTHRSYLNENPKWDSQQNERLEFLGDAVLELVVTENLYNRYPDYPEGKLTPIRSALVNYQIMADIAKNLNVDDFILLSKGESKDTGRAREVILANALESVIGAIYLDGGYRAAKIFIENFILERLEGVMRNKLYKDAKSELQERIQETEKVTPTYQVIDEAGPDHKKEFVVGVYFGDRLIAEGKGLSKHDAEVEAAREALKDLN
jgi:ribonuclease III